MTPRRLEGETWDNLVEHVGRFPGPLAVAWATVRLPGLSTATVLTFSIRATEDLKPVHHVYDRLELRRVIRTPDQVAQQLITGIVEPGLVEFTAVESDQSVEAYWVGRNDEFGRTGLMARPSFYCAHTIVGRPFEQYVVQKANLDAPLSGAGERYWPKAKDAIFEVVYGITRHQRRRDITLDLVVHLPYFSPHLAQVGWVEGEGLIATVADPFPVGGAAFQLHFVWSSDQAEGELHHHEASVTVPGEYRSDVPSAPFWYALGLVAADGELVDNAEGSAAIDEEDYERPPLPPEAMHEAFDFLASVWRNVFNLPFFDIKYQITSIGTLALGVGGRSDFESRLSDLSDLIKAIRIPEELLADAGGPNVVGDQTLNRLDSALRRRLGGGSVEYDRCHRALEQIRRVNDVRNGLEHSRMRRGKDFPNSTAALGLSDLHEWPNDWERLRHIVCDSVAEIRRTLQSAV
jgi:hypothetical protein